MKIVIAPNSFKDSISAIEVCQIIENTIKEMDNSIEIIKIPLADGGDGTIDALHNSLGGKIRKYKTLSPKLDKNIYAPVLILDNKSVVVEIASSSGLNLLKPNERDPLKTGSYGTGLLIDKFIRIYDEIILAVGGSSTVDGGMGILDAVGFKFYNNRGKILTPIGKNLEKIHKISQPKDLNRIKGKIKILADVQNPLLGENGTAKVFSKQKGASKKGEEILARGIKHFYNITKEITGINPDFSMAGASGGIPGFLTAWLNAKVIDGGKYIIKTAGFEKKSENADIIITGEGKIDCQTIFGKLPFQIALSSKKRGIKTIALTGSYPNDNEVNLQYFDIIYPLVTYPMELQFAIKNVKSLLKTATRRALWHYI